MNQRLRAYLELVRVPNLFTAAADSFAGFLFVGGTSANALECAVLVMTSVLIYAGGVALNDVCDAGVDRVERPGRPIPSGRVSRRSAAIVAIGLLLTGWVLSAAVSWSAVWVTGGVIAFVVLYDAVLKATVLGPGVMGICRAGNLFLGMCWLGASFDPEHLAPVLAMWLYVTSLTYFARQEAGMSSSRRLWLGGLGMGAAVAVTCRWEVMKGAEFGPLLLFAGALLGLIGVTGYSAIQCRRPDAVQRAVKAAILGIVLLDACFVATTRGISSAMLIAALIVPTMLAARMAKMT